MRAHDTIPSLISQRSRCRHVAEGNVATGFYAEQGALLEHISVNDRLGVKYMMTEDAKCKSECTVL